MKRKFSKRFKLLIKRVAIILVILASVPMAIWTGDGTATALLAIFGIPAIIDNEVNW